MQISRPILRAGFIGAVIFIVGMWIMFELLPQASRTSGSIVIDSAEFADMQVSIESRSGSDAYGDYLVIDRLEAQGTLSRVYELDFKEMKPWKLEVADIDGDGQLDILIAVHKMAHFDNQMRNRMFIFNFEDGVLVKKWTGSQIAGDWDQFYAEELLSIPGDELMILERLDERRSRLHIYYWLDFGFVALAISQPYSDVSGFTVEGENRITLTYEVGGQAYEEQLMVVDGHIVAIHEH